MNSRLSYALRYAQLGWSVFPCLPREKRPGVPNGHRAATTDPERIRGWWTARPDWNVAIALPDNVVVLDLDDPAALERLHHQRRDLPTTVTARTARGWHYWYGSGEPGTQATVRLPDLPGIDVKGSGGFVLVPPSVHPSGALYTWRVPPRPEYLAYAPEWLIQALRSTPRLGAVLTEGGRALQEKALAGVPEGERNNTLFRYASQLRYRDLPRHEAEILVSRAAAQRRPPLPAREVAKLLVSAWRYAPGKVDDTAGSSVA